MKIIADVRVWSDSTYSEDTKIEITKEDLAELAEQKALKKIDGQHAETINIQLDLSF